MFLWFSYQIEIEAFGAGQTFTATDCNKERPCTFKEFIKHVANGKLELEDWSKVRRIFFIWSRKTEADVLETPHRYQTKLTM